MRPFITLLLLVAGLVTIAPATAQAIPIFFSVGDEKVIKVQDLPDTEYFYNETEGGYVDVGYCFRQATVFFVPVWNYDSRLCGYIGRDDAYLDVSRDDLQTAAAMAGLTEFELPQPQLPFWDRVGGKLALAGILLVIILVLVALRRGD